MARAIADHTSAAGAAAEAVRLVQTAPARAIELARAAAEQATRERDAAAGSTAERALGLAAKELKDIPASLRHLRRAIRIAERGGESACAAEARMSLALSLAYAGDTPRAIEAAEAAAVVLRGADGARLQAQRALILQRLGAWDEALRGYAKALSVLRRGGDTLWEARLLNNRGLLRGYRGEARAAEGDLRRAGELYRTLGQEFAVAEVEHNLGFVAARRGDVPVALAHYDAADAYFRARRLPRAIYLVDRCELLLSVHLVEEARAAAEQAVTELAAGGMASDLAEARLMLAEAALAAGDPALARSEAKRAAAAFQRQGRGPWAALAAWTELRAQWQHGPHTPTLLAAARTAAEQLAHAGWGAAAVDARVMAGRLALGLGRLKDARAELAPAAAARRGGPVLVRAHAWHAEGLLRAAEGHPGGAKSALRAGLRVVEDYCATLGATELRAHAAADGAELAVAGLRLSLASGSPRDVLAWSERWRASALRTRPVRPPDDDTLVAELTQLRQVTTEAEEAARAGRDARRLLTRQRTLEESIRRRSRQARGGGERSDLGASATELTGALGKRALIELLRVDGALHAVTLVDGRARLHALGASAEVDREADAARFSLARLARPGSRRALDAAAAAAAHAAHRLEERLLRPLAPAISDRPLVIVPTGPLHALPWAALPFLRGRPVTVAPSARLWLRGSHARAAANGAVLVAGPGLDGAAAEVAELSRLHPRARTLVGAAACVDSTLRALDGVALAHVAAHGTFRADNPLFSALHLHDGPLTVYDLETLARPPRLLVLAACDGAAATVRPGDELMGLAAALLGLGTATIVASVCAVADDAAHALMIELHRRLVCGADLATALAHAQAELIGAAPSAAGFVCLGGS